MRFSVFYLPLLLATFPFRAVAQSGIISTFAGNGVATSSGDGGPATAASINHPIGMVRDGAGNIYIAENGSHKIRKVSPAGIITTIAGTGIAGFTGDGGPATAARLNQPYWIDVDNSGSIYIADAFNNRIRKINAAGIISTIAGTGVGSYTGDGGPATAATLYTPTCVRLDNAGNIYFTDNSNHVVRKISPVGIISTVAGTGTAGFLGDGGAATAARLRNPSSVWPDASGNIFISDAENNRVRKVNTSGVISTIAGNGGTGLSGDGGPATAAQIHIPEEALMDASGNLYIGDNWNHRVRKVSPAGIITTVAGTTMGFSGDGGPATAAQLRYVNGICFGPSGAIYIADVLNHRIRVIGAPTTNNPPSFVKGHSADIKMCVNEMPHPYSLDTLLAGSDLDLSQTLSWSIVTGPAHGTATVTYASTSTSGTVTPSGLTYLPASGYIGTDMFSVAISDGTLADTMTIYATMETYPVAATISGEDTVCQGDLIWLTSSVAGGTWSVLGMAAGVGTTGGVTGLVPGADTIVYTVTNSCTSVPTQYPVWVLAASDCSSFVSAPLLRGISLYPNPNGGDLTVYLPGETGAVADVTICNLLGQPAKRLKVNTGQLTQISVDMPDGVYLLTATTPAGTIVTKFTVDRR